MSHSSEQNRKKAEARMAAEHYQRHAAVDEMRDFTVEGEEARTSGETALDAVGRREYNMPMVKNKSSESMPNIPEAYHSEDIRSRNV